MYCSFKYTQKENVDNLLRLRSLRHRQTPIYPKRVNVHAERRELSTSVLDKCSILANWREQESKVDAHPICPYISIAAHRHCQFMRVKRGVNYFD